MKVVIISNCQGESIGKCMSLMNPGITTEFIMSTEMHTGAYSLGELVDNHDIVFVQKNAIDISGLSEGQRQKIKSFPSIAFTGFHPDMTYVRGRSKQTGNIETVFTPMYSYNSSLVLYCYLAGKTVSETVEMFNSSVFERLGFFSEWDAAITALIDEGLSVGVDLASLLREWIRRGIFMHSFNHPAIYVLGDLASLLLESIDVPVINKNVCQFLADPLALMPVWPVYTEIAKRLGLNGDYAFKQNEQNHIVDLAHFVQVSFTSYDTFDRDTLEPMNFSLDDYKKRLTNKASLDGIYEKDTQVKSSQQSSNPYKALPDYQFWKRSVAQPNSTDVDPVVSAKFPIGRDQRVATAGSCFAQHIAKTLAKSGFNYYVAETAPENLTEQKAFENNYGVFSARYGNIYTVRQLLQLMERAYGLFLPVDVSWRRVDGKLIDPFRPQISLDGFESEDELVQSQKEHFFAVRSMLENMEVFVFTLGLTEGWRSKVDGAVFPLAPGVVAEGFDDDLYEFVNFNIDDIRKDMYKCIDFIRKINPDCKVLLTISPVPLIATYEPQHALVATTYSKSVLRVVADEMVRNYSHVAYFPSYEIIVGSFNKGQYYEEDLRSVRPEGVAHVMRLFSSHYMNAESKRDIGLGEGAQSDQTIKNSADRALKHNVFDIVCDEEAIAKF